MSDMISTCSRGLTAASLPFLCEALLDLLVASQRHQAFGEWILCAPVTLSSAHPKVKLKHLAGVFGGGWSAAPHGAGLSRAWRSPGRVSSRPLRVGQPALGFHVSPRDWDPPSVMAQDVLSKNTSSE